MKLYIYILTFNLVVFLILQISFFFRNKKTPLYVKLISNISVFVTVYVIAYYLLNKQLSIKIENYFYYMVFPSFSLFFLINYKNFIDMNDDVSRKDVIRKQNKDFIKDLTNSLVFSTKQGVIHINNFFTHFLVIAGTRGGKTKSVGLPLLKQYMLNAFCGFVYDAKEFDYTKYVYYFKHILKYNFSVYHLSFSKMDKTYRTNIIKPSLIKEPSFLAEIIRDIGISLSDEDSKKDEWFNAGIGVTQAIAIRFFYDFKEHCTIPHVALFLMLKTPEEIINFVSQRIESRIYADELIKSSGSPKTSANILWSASQTMKSLASNKKICYVLSGDDFNFNLVEKDNPKIITVSNDRESESVLSGFIGSMVNILGRQIKFGNEQPTFFFMDEGTTFKVPNFSHMIGLLAEYKVSFAFLTQSISKIEEVYKSIKKISIVSNFNNVFLGRTNVVRDAKEYSLIFGNTKVKKITENEGVSNSVRNKSTSTGRSKTDQKELIFEADHFLQQKQGEFTCNFLDSNYKSGVFNLNMEDINEEELEEVVLNVSNANSKIVEDVYEKIILFVESIIIDETS